MSRILIAIAVLVSTSAVPAAEPRKLAFIVGVSEYQKDGLTNLNYADDDAEALRDALKAIGFEVDTLLRNEATGENLRKRFTAFLEKTAQLGKEDVVFVSLSGHGIQLDLNRDGAIVTEAFYCPYDALKTNPATLVPINEFIRGLQDSSGSSQNLMVIDACRNDPTRGGKGLDGSTVRELPAKLSLLFGCSTGQQSFESDKVKHGILTHVLLEGLKGEAADRRGVVTWLSLANYAATEVPVQARTLLESDTINQRPNLVGNLVLIPVLARIEIPVTPPSNTPPANTPIPQPPSLPIPANLQSTTNSIGMKLILIPAGEFQMGSPSYDSKATDDEKPQHRVRNTKPFYLGQTEVTRGQFAAFVAAENYRTEPERDGKGAYGVTSVSDGKLHPEFSWRNPDFAQTDDHPVGNVTYSDAVAFCNWLSTKENKTYRLPTEAEWEYACRAGTTTKYYHGNDPEGLVEFGNVADGAVKEKFPNLTNTIDANDGYVYTAPVGRFKPNAWGLYDMAGNVGEWCYDWYDKGFYKSSPVDDPLGTTGEYRMYRGGAFSGDPARSRSAHRFPCTPSVRLASIGFRVALVP